MSSSNLESAYVLGVNDSEIARLELQHRAWRASALGAWEAAGIHPGQSVLDLGCGPGYAAIDLAEVVGPQGRVVAVDKSDRFLEIVRSNSAQTHSNISTEHVDLEASQLPQIKVSGIWCRWVLSFVKNPYEVLKNAITTLEPGGSIVLQEYFHYGTWRAAPGCTELDEFVSIVMASWRDAGGEPDIALRLPTWLEELGLKVKQIRPLIDVTEPGSLRWAWLRAFVESGRHRLVELGYLSADRADAIWSAFEAMESARGVRMVTPAVLEIIARREV
jgi:SAM-dependent methyltransferase